METEKLQRLYDTLEKLRPKGKYGGLGNGSVYAGQRKAHDPTLPNNPLYSNFVRPGAFHKRGFDENESKEDENGGTGFNSKKTKFSDDDENDDDETELQQRIRKELLRALKDGKQDRKIAQKSIQKALDNPKGSFKKMFKTVVNVLIDEDKIELSEDGTLGLMEKEEKKKEKKKKEKKEKRGK